MITENSVRKKKNDAQDKDKKADGLLMKWLETATNVAVNLSLGRLLEKIKPSLLDIYFVTWLSFQIITLLLLVFYRFSGFTQAVLLVLFSYRLLEIGVTMFDSVFISVIQKKRHRSIPRLFSLVVVSYLEVALTFGIIFNFLMGHPSVLNTLNTSVSLVTLAGFSFDKTDNAIFAASIAEMLLGIFFVTGVIAAIASYLGAKE
jgi:hypothetical protein